MILFSIMLSILITIVIVFIIGGIGGLIIFGDLLVCILILAFIAKLMLKRRGTR